MQLAHCRYCDNDYPTTDFEITKCAKGKVYRRRKCKFCKSDYQKKRQQRIVAWFIAYKKTLHCARCGIADPRVLTFHHREPERKIGNLADLARRGWSLTLVREEIAKCDVLCANCHLISHHEASHSIDGV